ncbi:MAG: adenosylcobinamide-GDP ribazoletransferase [Thermaerobacter sp.]|nr:adenosylcobinamide-GDP ribazoletransferase [Thermaerobacter sp.]
MRQWRRLALALTFLTIVPIRVPAPVTDADMTASAAYYPLVGAGLGGLLLGLADLMHAWPSFLAAAVLAAVYTVATGALHLDGLMDTADALASRQPPAEALAIMKDSRVGAAGALAGVLVLVIKIAAWTALLHRPLFPWFVAIPAVARTGMLWAVAHEPAAPRGDAPTLAGQYHGAVPTRVVLLWAAGVLAALLAAGGSWTAVWVTAGGLALAAGAARATTRWLGGMTGDTYGAVNELVEVWGWIVAAVAS